MATLYRKYRPQNFAEVVNQNHIKITLEHEIASGKLAHAYLFCGPRAVGKTTMARVLAKAVNCRNRKDGECEPCNNCLSCREITEGRSFDLMEIDAASHTGVDNVRENIIASARVAPLSAKYKIFIIDEAHMLSTSAFNALLKIMEEPPAAVIFILCTTEIHKVPTTIISRCQRFDFKKISLGDIIRKLEHIVRSEGVAVSKGVLESVARQSGGHMRDAESILGQIVSIAGKEVSDEEAGLVIPRGNLGEAVSLVEFLAKKDAGSAIRLLNNLLNQGVDLKVFTAELIEVLRKMMIANASPLLAESLGLDLGESLEVKIMEVNKDLSQERIISLIERFSAAQLELKHASLIQLPLELAVVKACISQPAAAPETKFFRPEAPKPGIAAKPEVFRPKPAPAGTPLKLTIGDIKGRWNEVLAKVKSENHSLSFVLKVCEPKSLDGGDLCLAFKYKFHKDRIEDNNIRVLVEKILMEIYQNPLSIQGVIDENLEFSDNNAAPIAETAVAPAVPEPAKSELAASEPAEAGGNLIDNILKTFGGRVVS